MNKFVKWITLFLVSVVLLGCGEDTPEDVAVSFVKSLSKADIDDAKKSATEEVQKSLDRLEGLCNKEYYKELSDEVFKIDDKFFSYTYKNDKVKEKFKEVSKKIEKIKKSLMHKYGDTKSIKDLPLDKQKEFITEYLDKVNVLTEPIVFNVLDDLKLDLKHKEITMKLYSKYFTKKTLVGKNVFQSNRDFLMQIIEEGDYADSKNMSAECVAKYTKYGFIESVNLIEEKKESLDEVVVRLELIDKKDKSNKVSIDVEKIKGEWKVSILRLQNWEI